MSAYPKSSAPRYSAGGIAASRRPSPSQLSRTKGVAGFDGSLLKASHEPALALLRRAVGEGIRHHAPIVGLALQRIVAYRRRRGQRRIDVAWLEEARTLLFFAVDPDA